jgi:hypothetical protein
LREARRLELSYHLDHGLNMSSRIDIATRRRVKRDRREQIAWLDPDLPLPMYSAGDRWPPALTQHGGYPDLRLLRLLHFFAMTSLHFLSVVIDGVGLAARGGIDKRA